MKLSLLLIAAIAVASPCWAQPADAPVSEKDQPAYRPPIAGEAHGMTGAERETALLVFRSHYQNLLETFSSLQLIGLDRKDFSKPATCEVRVVIDPKDFRASTFVDGLPVRRAQPIVFNSFQRQLIAGVAACEPKIVFTTRTWADLEAKASALLIKNSGTTYCQTDEDCFGVELGADSCGTRPAQRAFGSISTDAVLFLCLRKFMPPLMENLKQMVNGTIILYGDKHPDHGVAMGSNQCPMKHWTEASVEAACVQHSCRAKRP